MSRGIGYGYGYHGNLHIKCWHCGHERSYYSKREVEVYKCLECGKKTALTNMTKCFINCECGNGASYLTNCDGLFEIECYACGQPVAMMPKRKKGKKMIYTSIYSEEERRNKRKK